MQEKREKPRIVAAPLNSRPPSPHRQEKSIMAKGQQRSNKETKKPKKDSAPPKAPVAGTSEPVRPVVTTAVIPRGKLKNK